MDEKRGLAVFLIFLLVMLLGLQNIKAIVVTGQGVTGKASSQTLNVSIQIISFVPTLTILSPENETYLINVSLLLNYTTNNSRAVWYNVDGSGNTTLANTIGAIYFNTTEGSHVLLLYANNTDGIKNSTSIRFSVNLTLFTINYTEWRGAFKGDSTELYIYSYEDMQSLGNIILEESNSAKILFNQAVNLTDDANFSDHALDLDSNVNTSFNRIELNASALPNFNKQATLWLYGLSFTNPRILLNGAVCSASVCTQESYSGGILKFNVTGFSGNAIYSAEETPTTNGGGGGGGGGVISCTNGANRTCTSNNCSGTQTCSGGSWSSCKTTCSSCSENWICTGWSDCSSQQQTRECTEKNKCNTTLNKPLESQECQPSCQPNWSCGGWSSCIFDYSLNNLIENKVTELNAQKRECIDLNRCYTESTEIKSCESDISIEARKVKWCYEDYVEIYDKKDNRLISRLKESNVSNIRRIDIGFVISDETQYCPYCYNKVKDYDETGIDCGGICKPCVELPLSSSGITKSTKVITKWLWWLLIILMIILMIIIYLHQKQKKGKDRFNWKSLYLFKRR